MIPIAHGLRMLCYRKPLADLTQDHWCKKNTPLHIAQLFNGQYFDPTYSVFPPTGEAMEQGLRDCCRSIRIGKILIQSDEETQKAKVYYAKFPPDVYRRKVLLMYPILSK